MSTDLSAPAASPASSEPSPSFLSILGNLLVAPREAFAAIVRKPSPWLALAVLVAAHVVLVSVWIPQMDGIEYVRNQQEVAGQEVKLPPPEAGPVIKLFTAGAYLVLPPLVSLVAALVFWGIYRFFYGAELSFKQSLAIVAWAFVVIAIVTVPLILGAMAVKGDWNDDAGNVLAANATLFLDRSSISKPLYAMVKALDLFALWTVWLLASGFGVASRKSTASAAWGIVVPWLCLVGLGVGAAAIF